MIESPDDFLYLSAEVVTAARDGRVGVYSKSGSVLLDGPDARFVVETVFPLLDGTRNEKELIKSIPEIAPADLINLLHELREQQLIEVSQKPAFGPHVRDERRQRLLKTTVTVCGAERWTALCVEALNTAGLPHVDTRCEEDIRPDLAVCISNADDEELLRNFAETMSRLQVPSLACTVYEHEVIIGPLALPNRSACWMCGELRLRANSPWNEPPNLAPGNVFTIDSVIARHIAAEVCEIVCLANVDSRLVNNVLIFDRVSSKSSLHRILRVPGCAVCGGPDQSEDLSGEGGIVGVFGSSSELTMRALSCFVDSRTGVINQVIFDYPEDTGISSPLVCRAITANAPSYHHHQKEMPAGWGKGIMPSDAVLSALGESIERYCASMPDPASIVWSKPVDLDGDILEPQSFALYSGDQYADPRFPYVRYDRDVVHPWIAGRWAESGVTVWVPAMLTYLSLVVCPEHHFCQGTSNGLAAGTDPEEAALRAILELIERDTFITSWHGRQAGIHICPDHRMDKDLADVLSAIGAIGGQIELVLLESVCGYPTAVCLAFGDGTNWPGVTLGLGTDPDPRTAIRQAILEQGQTGPYLRRRMRTARNAKLTSSRDVTEMMDHATFYFPPERAEAFDYLRDDSTICSFSDLPDRFERSLPACSRLLSELGIRVALVDVTSKDIATTQFCVVRAISPDLQPVSFGYGLERLLIPRLSEIITSPRCKEVVPIW